MGTVERGNFGMGNPQGTRQDYTPKDSGESYSPSHFTAVPQSKILPMPSIVETMYKKFSDNEGFWLGNQWKNQRLSVWNECWKSFSIFPLFIFQY